MAEVEEQTTVTTNPKEEAALEGRTLVASDGVGPLLQRDYQAAIVETETTPEQLILMLREEFPRFSPDRLCTFKRPEGAEGLLDVGDQLAVWIPGVGWTGVTVAQVDAQSLTLQTVEGHPEAGRITFGATRDPAGNLLFRIRSRARSSDTVRRLGFKVFGKHIQKQIWLAFITNVAEACGGRLEGEVREDTLEVQETLADMAAPEVPTFPVE